MTELTDFDAFCDCSVGGTDFVQLHATKRSCSEIGSDAKMLHDRVLEVSSAQERDSARIQYPEFTFLTMRRGLCILLSFAAKRWWLSSELPLPADKTQLLSPYMR